MKTTMMILCLALAACAETGMNSGSSYNTAATASPADQWNGEVVLIEPATDISMAAGGASGAMAAGSSGSSPTKAYRITLRKDDGTTEIHTVNGMPSYKPGDRVSYRNGQIAPMQ